MSGSAPAGAPQSPDDRSPRVTGRAWTASRDQLPHCGHDHAGRPGRLDESQRRLDHPELAAARMLVAEGHTVRTIREGSGRGPTADFDVCGTPTEIKTLIPQAERRAGRPANDRSVFNQLMRGIDQGAVTIVMAKGSGLRPADAAAAVNRFSARADQGSTRAVRCVGDGWDLSWSTSRRVAREMPRRPGRDPGRERDRAGGLGFEPG